MHGWRSQRLVGRRGLAIALLVTLTGCGASNGPTRTGGGAPARGTAANRSSHPGTAPRTIITAPRPVPRPRHPVVLSEALRRIGSQFRPVVSLQGQTAAWMARLPSGVTVLYFDRGLVTLALHSGTIDAGSSGWHYGPAVLDGERTRLIAAFNGGFKLETGSGGFV